MKVAPKYADDFTAHHYVGLSALDDLSSLTWGDAPGFYI
jgi:hypothetical protein